MSEFLHNHQFYWLDTLYHVTRTWRELFNGVRHIGVNPLIIDLEKGFQTEFSKFLKNNFKNSRGNVQFSSKLSVLWFKYIASYNISMKRAFNWCIVCKDRFTSNRSRRENPDRGLLILGQKNLKFWISMSNFLQHCPS